MKGTRLNHLSPITKQINRVMSKTIEGVEEFRKNKGVKKEEEADPMG